MATEIGKGDCGECYEENGYGNSPSQAQLLAAANCQHLKEWKLFPQTGMFVGQRGLWLALPVFTTKSTHSMQL